MQNKTLDSRDYSKEPCAILNPVAILKMREMIRMAAYVGDMKFDLVEAMFRNRKTED